MGSHAETDQWGFSGIYGGVAKTYWLKKFRIILGSQGLRFGQRRLEFWGRSYTRLVIYNSHNWTYAGYVIQEVPRSVDAIL